MVKIIFIVLAILWTMHFIHLLREWYEAEKAYKELKESYKDLIFTREQLDAEVDKILKEELEGDDDECQKK